MAALDVALLRIVLSALVAGSNELERALRVAAGAKQHLIAPAGLGWFLRSMPIDLATATLVRNVHLSAAALALVGLYARPALAVLTGTTFYLFALNQLGGAVLHDMHMIWFLGILALAAPAEALSLDAWLASQPSDPLRTRLLGDLRPRTRHALPIACIGTLLGLVYFFPGAWKLAESGTAWALSDNVVNQMHAKWLQHGAVPTPRIDRAPALVQLGALLAIAFELSFVFLVQVGPRTRILLLLAGVIFHLSIQRFLLIPFASLWLCYVGLVPWSGLFDRGSTTRAEHTTLRVGALPIAFVLMALALLERGVRGITQSYPFACYPTFQHRVGPSLQDLRVLASGAGTEWEIPIARDAAGRRDQAGWAMTWSLAGVYGVPFSAQRVASYLRSDPRAQAACVQATSIRVELTMRPTAPERWSDPPASVRTLATIPWPAP